MPLFREKKTVIKMFDPITKAPINNDEEKPYLVIFRDVDDEEDTTDYAGEAITGRYIAVRGRISAFEYIKSELYNIDPTKSYVFAGNIPLGKEVSVYSFIRLCLEKNMVDESDSFNIEELNDYIINNLGIDVDLNLLYNSEINKPLTK